jgi:hypothetical protein
MLTTGSIGSDETAVASEAVSPPGMVDVIAAELALATLTDVALADVVSGISAATRLDAALVNWAVAVIMPDAAMLIALLMDASDTVRISGA